MQKQKESSDFRKTSRENYYVRQFFAKKIKFFIFPKIIKSIFVSTLLVTDCYSGKITLLPTLGRYMYFCAFMY
jgi:hypothetical protein